MGSDPEFRPAPPIARRLNRNALTVAAVIMGMTVLTAVVVLSPGRSGRMAAPGPTTGAPALPSRPTFLDEPARGAEVGADSTAVDSSSLWPAGAAQGRPTTRRPRQGRTLTTSGGEVISAGREQAFEAALRSPLLGGNQAMPAGAGRVGAGALGTRSEPASTEERLLALGDSLTSRALRPPIGRESASSRQRDFLTRAGDAGGASVLARLEPAGSRYTLRAGTVIPGLLVTAINSELPGDIVGQVSRNVYDTRSQRILLIPKGSKLIGTYDNQVAAGQGRLLVAWTRLILPDGRSMRLPGLALKDPAGQTGAADRVDHHHGRVFGRALLLSAISAAAQLSQPRQGSILAAPSTGQVAAGALGQELSTVALEILRRGLDVAPNIRIREGQPFHVFVNGDLVFDGPYEPEP